MSRVCGHDTEELGGPGIIGVSGGCAVAVADLSDLSFLFLFQRTAVWLVFEWIKCISNLFKKINPILLITLS
jgi:hypothetical protein